MDFDSRNMQSVLSTEFREDTVWYHIKIKENSNYEYSSSVSILSKTTFWLGGDSEEEIYKILKRKHKINKQKSISLGKLEKLIENKKVKNIT